MDIPLVFIWLRFRWVTQDELHPNIFINQEKTSIIYLFFFSKMCILIKSHASLMLNIKDYFSVGAFSSYSLLKLSGDQHISQTSAFYGYLHVLLLHLCPVCALKAMFPGLHTPVMDGMKYIIAPRGALHLHNSPELTSSSFTAVLHKPHSNWDLSATGPNGKQDAWFEGRNGRETCSCQMLFPLCWQHFSRCGLLFEIHAMIKVMVS